MQQELRFAPEVHRHDDADLVCVDCITSDLLHRDFRRDLALLASIHLKELAIHRAADVGVAWREVWHDILDRDRLRADLRSNDPARSAAAERAQVTVGHFRVYRKAMANPQALSIEPFELDEIQRRTWACLDAIEREGGEPELFGQLVN